MRRHAHVRTALALAGALGAWPLAAQDLSQVQVRAEKVAGRVHVLFGQGGNIGLIAAPEGSFLVDDQFAPLSEKIRAAVSQVGGGEVRFLVNTHWHGDHTGGNEELGKRGVAIVAHANVRHRMSTEQFLSFFNLRSPPQPASALPVITFTDGVVFHWAGETIRVEHVPPAHTDGDSILHFVESDVLHAGDVFFNGTYPFIDVDGGGHLDGMIAACDRILEIAGPTTKIIPGHGAVGDAAALRSYQAMLKQVRAAVLVPVQAGLTEDATVAAKPTAALDAKWGGGMVDGDSITQFAWRSLTRKR